MVEILRITGSVSSDIDWHQCKMKPKSVWRLQLMTRAKPVGFHYTPCTLTIDFCTLTAAEPDSRYSAIQSKGLVPVFIRSHQSKPPHTIGDRTIGFSEKRFVLMDITFMDL